MIQHLALPDGQAKGAESANPPITRLVAMTAPSLVNLHSKITLINMTNETSISLTT